jgi:hypothetical protein
MVSDFTKAQRAANVECFGLAEPTNSAAGK